MATYAIGDLQGCYASFQALLQRVNFEPQRDRLWLVGDLINRGPQSLETLRWCHAHRDAVITVLGNHDLHFLAVAFGASPFKPHKDTFADILDAPDREVLVEWLRRQPLIHVEAGHVMCHAGINPRWTVEQAQSLAAEVERVLRGDDLGHYFGKMYGNQPAGWDDSLTGADRLRVITNYFTRMRLCDADGALELSYKRGLANIPKGYYPWFNTPSRIKLKERVLFGHWAALLGRTDRDDTIALDTGCVWGGDLSAYCIETGQIIRQPCQETNLPTGDMD